MISVFLTVVNLSMAATILIVVALLTRLALKKAPAWIRCALWGLVALRLLLPFSIPGILSEHQSTETVPAETSGVVTVDTVDIEEISSADTDVSQWKEVSNTFRRIVLQKLPEEPAAGTVSAVTPSGEPSSVDASSEQTLFTVLCAVWLCGIAGMLVYAVVRRIRLGKHTAARIPFTKGVDLCDGIPSSFILGIFHPRIILPSGLNNSTVPCVIAHEKAHLSRMDHVTKPFAYLLLSVYWFHPLCWVSYRLLCRDMEAACDEKVVRDMDRDGKATYSQALLDCSLPKRTAFVYPLSFSGGSVKGRIKNVLNYKKPGFWVVPVSILVCALLTVCFLIVPTTALPDEQSTEQSGTEQKEAEKRPEDILGQRHLLLGDVDYAGYKILTNDIKQGLVVSEIVGTGNYAVDYTYSGKVVLIDDPSRVYVGTAPDSQKNVRGQHLTEMMADQGAVCGMNASGFIDPAGEGVGGAPVGMCYSGGKPWGDYGDYVDYYGSIVMTTDNNLAVGKVDSWDKYNIRDGIQFGPVLLADGKEVIDEISGSVFGLQPRAAIGQRADGVIVFLVIDGRGAGGSAGCQISDLTKIMKAYNVVNAACCDGGASSVLAYNGELITNNCSADPQHGRLLPNAWLVRPKAE